MGDLLMVMEEAVLAPESGYQRQEQEAERPSIYLTCRAGGGMGTEHALGDSQLVPRPSCCYPLPTPHCLHRPPSPHCRH
jgi:hypothetical protein